jgi:hypothetical protein
LSGADLSETDLSGTDFSGANLYGAKGVTILELERQAKSLQDATMHDGRKYEDWVENRGAVSRKGRTPVLYSCS